MNLTGTKSLLDALEESPERVQLHFTELESLIAPRVDAILDVSDHP